MKLAPVRRRSLGLFIWERYWTPPAVLRLPLRLITLFVLGWVAGSLAAVSGRLGLMRSNSLAFTHQDPDGWVFVAFGVGVLLYLVAAALWVTVFVYPLWRLISDYIRALLRPPSATASGLPNLMPKK